MIYLIGGVPRAGKSRLAQKLVEQKRIPFISTDQLLWMLIDTLPEKKIRETYEGVPERFFPFLQAFIKHTEDTVPDYVIEGDAFGPAQVSILQKEFKINACFLGVSQITTSILKEHMGHNTWFDEMPKEEQERFPLWLVEQSQRIRTSCESHGQYYVDMAVGDYLQNQERAYQLLIAAKVISQ